MNTLSNQIDAKSGGRRAPQLPDHLASAAHASAEVDRPAPRSASFDAVSRMLYTLCHVLSAIRVRAAWVRSDCATRCRSVQGCLIDPRKD